MKLRRETIREHIADTIRFVLLPSWKVALVLPLVLLFAWLMWFNATRPALARTGEIVSFGQHPGRFGAAKVAIVVRSEDGTISELVPEARRVAHCRVGDRITYTRETTGLRIEGCV